MDPVAVAVVVAGWARAPTAAAASKAPMLESGSAAMGDSTLIGSPLEPGRRARENRHRRSLRGSAVLGLEPRAVTGRFGRHARCGCRCRHGRS